MKPLICVVVEHLPPPPPPGTKEKVLIDILTNRSNAQRQLIIKAYEQTNGRVRLHS